MTISIQTTPFSYNYHSSQRAGCALHGYYDFHNADVYNDFIVNGRELSAVYQCGQSYLYGDYDCPRPEVELSAEGGTDRILHIVDSMTEQDLDNPEAVEYYIAEIADDLISNQEDLSALYFALRENNNNAKDFSEEIFDEDFNYDFID